ncbi:MAG: methylated-DNA--[protein]-cysteine S-methyltransferase [Bacteroidetes bacterium]|nr:methylated-DNA--[protein]-cysteine S-methyltransferase [Bacteroidota bacterium]
MIVKYIDTPLGKMRAGATDEGICLFDFEGRRMMDSIMKRIETLSGEKTQEGDHFHFKMLEKQINEYFNGERKQFDLPLYLLGTPFQKRVWEGLMKIPFGDTRSYKEQSIFLGDVKAIRAVAGANGENGIAIIVPCHRVVGANGSLVGYGGGLWRKKWLLGHELKYSGKSNQMDMFS